MPGRFEFERAIRRSGLPPLSRLLALTIATWADLDSGVIPEQHQPAQSVLLEATGMSKGTFLTHRATLVTAGWVSFKSPDADRARREHAQCEYFIHIPARSAADPAKPMQKRTKPTGARSGADLASPEARSAADLELGQELTQGLGQELTTRVPPESRKSQRTRATSAPDALVVTDAMREWARSRSVPADRIDRETERFLDHHRAKGSTFKDWPAAWRTWMSRAAEYGAPRPAPRQVRWADPVEQGIF